MCKNSVDYVPTGINKVNKISNKDQLISQSFSLHNWLSFRLHDLEISTSKRRRLSVSCHDQVFEHHLAICLLIRSKVYGSAFALVRPIFEGFVRGVWLKNLATDAELEKYYDDTLDLKFWQLLDSVEKFPGFESGMLSGLKKSSWKAMNSYTHGGVLQASRRYTKEFFEPSYSDEEITEVLKISSSFALLAFQQIAAEANRLDLAEEAGEKLVNEIHSFT